MNIRVTRVSDELRTSTQLRESLAVLFGSASDNFPAPPDDWLEHDSA